MKLRSYISADRDAVIEIFRSNSPKYFTAAEEPGLRDFLSQFSADYFVGEIGREVIAAGGFALNNDETVSLCWGMIRSDLLGTGLGRKLTQFRIQEAHERHGNLPLIINTSQHTQGFYEKFGFRLVSRIPDGFAPGIDICKMSLEIPAQVLRK